MLDVGRWTFTVRHLNPDYDYDYDYDYDEAFAKRQKPPPA